MKRPKKRYLILAAFTAMLTGYYFLLPDQIFEEPYSTVLEDHTGELLCASIASDGQWRFPQTKEVPDKFAQALVAFEDKRFFDHPGIDVLSMSRAIKQNIKVKRIVSGGSTITMQTIRLSRKRKNRTIIEKIIEAVLATRLEFRYNKSEILSLYSSHAPFGGNVVGLDAACWRYFGRSSKEISWSEAALLAVLPNSPSLIHPGKNRTKLKIKRDHLLDKLKAIGKIDEFTWSLAKEEPLPDKPQTLPHHASHLLSRISKDGLSQQKISSTLNINLQQRVESIVEDHHQKLRANQVFNAAVVVLDIKSGHVLAYVGNTQNVQ